MYTKKQSPMSMLGVSHHTYICVSKREEIVRLRIKQRVKFTRSTSDDRGGRGKHKEEKKRKARTAKEMVKKKSPSGLMQSDPARKRNERSVDPSHLLP